ncbi:MAG TPA: response regulator [Gemmatimonadales bacterium]|nr:response regulator [Gemmatimonadales bacterium]
MSDESGIGPLVLVVDDEAESRSTICRMVRGLGYRAQACPSGREALDYLESHRREVRLLLADLAMPHMDGGELVERARDLDPTLRAVLMAESSEAEVNELLAGYRDLPVLTKPVGFSDLYGRLRELLGPAPTGSSRQTRTRSSRRSSGRHEV